MKQRGVMHILMAQMENGEIIVLMSDIERNALRRLRSQHQFYCPQCQSKVILKVGEVVIPHFAHEQKTSCRDSFSEGESPEHLLGKRLLFNFFQNKGYAVKMEPFLRNLSQRPDLVVETQKMSIPIEFQCSPIPRHKFRERSEGYRLAGMEPLWILNTPAKFIEQQNGIGIFQLSKFHEQFLLTTPNEGDLLFSLHPPTSTFHYMSSLLHIGGQRYIGLHNTLPYEAQTLPFSRPKAPSQSMIEQYYHLYKIQRNAFLSQRILLNRKGIQDPFLRGCYEMRLHPIRLPLHFGVPVAHNRAFREADCDWQIRLLYFLHKRKIEWRATSEKELWSFARQFDEPNEEMVVACKEYLSFLEQCGIHNITAEGKNIENKILRLISERYVAKKVYN